MSISVNSIPSINVPFVDESGRINPIWHEFLRKFVSASVEAIEDNASATISITAGNGLTGGGDLTDDVTLTVGQGAGIAVNGDDIAVDIASQNQLQVTLEDELLVSDVSNNNTIGKTRVRDVAALASNPSGATSTIQFNDNGIFGGDANFTTDGLGSVNLVGDLDVDNININGNNIISTNSNGDVGIIPNGTGVIRVDKAIANTAGDSTSRCLSLAGNNLILYGVTNQSLISMGGSGGWSIQAASGQTVQFTAATGILVTALNLNMNDSALLRSVTAGITASTTQSQGNGALTTDINEISTCANANDTVTLPSAIAGRHCLVINNGAQTLQVFPASGDNLGAGVNTSTTITAGSRKLFVAFDSTNYEPVI